MSRSLRKLVGQVPYAKDAYTFWLNCLNVIRHRHSGQDLNIPLFILKSMTYHLRSKPIYAHHRTRILNLERIRLNGVLSIGTTYRGFWGQKKTTLVMNFGDLIVEGHVGIGLGSRLEIGKDAYCRLTDCSINAESDFIVKHGLEIGAGSTISWGCQFLDENFHQVEYDGWQEKSPEIVIGQHVWIGSQVKVLRGVEISDGSMVAANSVVTRSFREPNVLIGGHPAKVIKTNIRWR